jgi:23S rRNA (uracil1939-C5)-methyltransferase
MPKKNRRSSQFIENVLIVDAAAEGVAVAKPDEKVVFIPFGAPGDVVDVEVFKKKRNYFEGKIINFKSYSEQRTKPSCDHFGICGGCKWQHLDYQWQLHYKQKQVKDNFERIGKIEYPEIRPIIGCDNQFYYRNKLEYTFSNRKWFTDGVPTDVNNPAVASGLGFHLPGMFDRILDIQHCHLQADPSNRIRLAVKEFAISNNYSFYDARNHSGFLRNLLIRNTTIGDLMVIVVTGYEDQCTENELLPFIAETFPEITSLMWVENTKKNDIINDLEIRLFSGKPFITEHMKSPTEQFTDLQFRIGPVSFYQTNSVQAEKLYKTAFGFAEFRGDELVYDLYTGTGTIANYIARYVRQVIGIEYVAEAIADAGINSSLNQIENTVFYTGDMVDVLNDEFVATHGKPDVIITDPPRAGMHEKVVNQILNIEPDKVVYISCNPATQARDLQLLDSKYKVMAVQPVDMFPQTHHVENVVLLIKRIAADLI